MASSKDKAIALKDNYVAGLIEAGATAPAPTMPEMDMGNPASIHRDVIEGRTVAINDGIPDEYLHNYSTGQSVVKQGRRDTAFPVQGGMFYFKNTSTPNYDYNDYRQPYPKSEYENRQQQGFLDAMEQTINNVYSGEGYRDGFKPSRQMNIDSLRKGKQIDRPYISNN